jgi:hypothetical protein
VIWALELTYSHRKIHQSKKIIAGNGFEFTDTTQATKVLQGKVVLKEFKEIKHEGMDRIQLAQTGV